MDIQEAIAEAILYAFEESGLSKHEAHLEPRWSGSEEFLVVTPDGKWEAQEIGGPGSVLGWQFHQLTDTH